MLKTLVRGESTIFAYRVIDATVKREKKEGRTTRTAVRMAQWKAVMERGLASSSIARYSDGSNEEEKPGMPRVFLNLPETKDTKACVAYRNELMRLCLLPLSTLWDRIREKEKVGTVEKKKKRSEAEGVDQDAVAEAEAAPKRRAKVLGYLQH